MINQPEEGKKVEEPMSYHKQRSYFILKMLDERRAKMPEPLYVALVATTSNAEYLYETTLDQGHPAYVHSALLLYDKAEQIIKQWDEDPEIWYAPIPAPEEEAHG